MNEEMKQKAKDCADETYGKISAAFARFAVDHPKTVMVVTALGWLLAALLWNLG